MSVISNTFKPSKRFLVIPECFNQIKCIVSLKDFNEIFIWSLSRNEMKEIFMRARLVQHGPDLTLEVEDVYYIAIKGKLNCFQKRPRAADSLHRDTGYYAENIGAQPYKSIV
jgi:hypothetical protein